MARNATRHSEPRVLASSRSAVVVPTPKFLSLAEAGILAHRRRRRDRSSFIAQRCKNRAPHPNELLPRRTWFWLNHPRGLIDQSCQRIADFGRLGFFPLSRSSSMRTKSCAKDTWQIAERRARDNLRATTRAREARARVLSGGSTHLVFAAVINRRARPVSGVFGIGARLRRRRLALLRFQLLLVGTRRGRLARDRVQPKPAARLRVRVRARPSGGARKRLSLARARVAPGRPATTR